jgi:hypothetical protein
MIVKHFDSLTYWYVKHFVIVPKNTIQTKAELFNRSSHSTISQEASLVFLWQLAITASKIISYNETKGLWKVNPHENLLWVN